MIKHKCRRFPKGWMNRDLEINYDERDKKWFFEGSTDAGEFNVSWIEKINFCPFCGKELSLKEEKE